MRKILASILVTACVTSCMAVSANAAGYGVSHNTSSSYSVNCAPNASSNSFSDNKCTSRGEGYTTYYSAPKIASSFLRYSNSLKNHNHSTSNLKFYWGCFCLLLALSYYKRRCCYRITNP